MCRSNNVYRCGPKLKKPHLVISIRIQPTTSHSHHCKNLYIQVYNSNPTDVDEVLGKIQIPIEELQTSKEFISDYYLDNKISKIKIKTQSSNSN